MNRPRVTLVWFRRDLRLQDNPALADAAASGSALLPVYIHAPAEAGDWPPGAASRWWLHHALAGLQKQLAPLGLPLVIRRGPSAGALDELVDTLYAAGLTVDAVVSARVHEPALVEGDAAIAKSLAQRGIGWRRHNASLLVEPGRICNQSGEPYRVFTPFWKRLRTLPAEPPAAIDTGALRAPETDVESLTLNELRLLPEKDWDAAFPEYWDPTPSGAAAALQAFVTHAVDAYQRRRDLPAVDGTSRLSPFLHFGQIGPRQVWAAVHAAGAEQSAGGFTFLSELAWREFSYHLLHHFPDTTDQPMQAKFRDFPWQPDAVALAAWQRGRTGYPFVDAGMRQLWRTGWMHNRVRMVTASFLVKHLLQPWQDGARWFWDTLVDADLASNTLGWQWVAGCGADAAPYFRIFNPFTQGEKFDPNGDYVREFVPELARLPEKWIHRPWDAPAAVLADAGVRLGDDYPEPIVLHRSARERALGAFEEIRQKNTSNQSLI